MSRGKLLFFNDIDIDGYDRQGYDKERINRKEYHISGRRVRK